MSALYCLLWKRWIVDLPNSEKVFCKLANRRCTFCTQCVFKEIVEVGYD